MEHWISVQVESAGASLADILQRFGSDLFTQRIALYIENGAASSPFAIAFLVRLSKLREDCHVLGETMRICAAKSPPQ